MAQTVSLDYESWMKKLDEKIKELTVNIDHLKRTQIHLKQYPEVFETVRYLKGID